MTQADLRRVRRAVTRLEAAEAELRDAIMAARDAGESYRDIAFWAGLSHQRVFQIVRDAQEARRGDVIEGDTP